MGWGGVGARACRGARDEGVTEGAKERVGEAVRLSRPGHQAWPAASEQTAWLSAHGGRQIVPAACGDSEAANGASGACACAPGAVRAGPACVPLGVLLPAALLPVAAAAALAAALAVRRRLRAADSVWIIDAADVRFEDPPKVEREGG